MGSGGATIGLSPRSVPDWFAVFLFGEVPIAGEAVGNAAGVWTMVDTVEEGVVGAATADGGTLPEGGGTGPNKVLPERAAGCF